MPHSIEHISNQNSEFTNQDIYGDIRNQFNSQQSFTERNVDLDGPTFPTGSTVIGEEFGTPDVTDFISDFDPRYEWLALLLDQYLTYVGGPEYTGLGDDRQYLPEEVQEIRELLAALEAGEEIDVESIRNDYPLLADYIENEYTGEVPESLADRVLQGDANAIIDVLIDEAGMSADEAKRLVDRVLFDPTTQDAVTLEGILSRAGYYVEGGILRLPDDGSAQAVDTDGDGVLDTAVIDRTGPNGEVVQVPVYGASGVDAQIEADQEKYNNIINQEGWDDLDDFEKNRILTQSGYNPTFGDRSLEDPDLDAAINDIYQDVLGRDPDEEGDDFWTNAWEEGRVTDQDNDGDVDYDDLRVLIETAAQPEIDQRAEQEQSIIDSAIDAVKDNFPTWEDLWKDVQSQLPSNPQEWGDVIRSVIEAAGIDLPDSDIWEILNGGYGVVWNPGGISGLPSGVGAIIQSGMIFIPGIPAGLPPSSTILSTIGDLVNAENPIDVLIQRATDILGDVVNDPSALINQIITDELDLPTDIWDIILGGVAVTDEVLDWLSENGFVSETSGDDTTILPGGEEEDTDEEDTGIQYGPDNPRPDDVFYQEVEDETVDPKDPTQYSTITEEEETSPQPGDPDFPTLVDDTAMGDYEEPSLFDDTTDDDTTVDDTTGSYTVVQDDSLFGDVTTTVDDTTIDDSTTADDTITVDDTAIDDTTGSYTVVQDDSLFDSGTTTVDDTTTIDDTTTNYTVIQDDSLFGSGTTTNTTTDFTEDFLNSTNTNITNTDNTVDTTGGNYTIVDEGSFFGDNTTTNTTTNYSEDFSEPAGSTNFTESTDTTGNGQSTDFSEDPYNPVNDTVILTGGEFEEDFYNPNNTETLTDVISDSGGGGGGGASFGGSDPSMFRQGLSYQLFSPQPIISGPQTNYAQGLLGGSSNQIRRTDTPVSMSLFGEYFA